MKFVDPKTVHNMHWLAEKIEKSKFAATVHWHSTWTVATDSQTRDKKKKNANAKRQTRNPNPPVVFGC